MDITSELADFLSRTARETDLIDIAERAPAETWRALIDVVREDISDADLARLASDVIDTIRVYAGEDLWQRMCTEAVANRQLARAVSAIERYQAKYVLFSRLLNGEHVDNVHFPAADLMLPNTAQIAAPVRDHVDALKPLTQQERAAFIQNDYVVWERVQNLIAYAPATACELADVLIESVAESDLARVGIALLEDLVTMREVEVSDYVIRHLRESERFRTALSHTYLNPSEQFLDELICAAAQSGAG